MTQARTASEQVTDESPGPAAQTIADDDVRDAFALLRVNYDRVVSRYGPPDAA